MKISEPDIEEFALMMEERAKTHGLRGRRSMRDVDSSVTKLYEAVHCLKDDIKANRNIALTLSDIGILCMKIAKATGHLSAEKAKERSVRVLSAAKDSMRDSSSKYAVIMVDKCTLWGADLYTDFEINDRSMAPILPKLERIFNELRSKSLQPKRVDIRGNAIRIWMGDNINEEDPIRYQMDG